jgi:uncharacterized protein involved in exopolysaccharide biosynthesis
MSSQVSCYCSQVKGYKVKRAHEGYQEVRQEMEDVIMENDELSGAEKGYEALEAALKEARESKAKAEKELEDFKAAAKIEGLDYTSIQKEFNTNK